MENWTIQNYQQICYGWQQFYSLMQRISTAEEFSKFKIASKSQRSLEFRASDRNRSIRISRHYCYWSTSAVTTTRNFEVLGAYFTTNWAIRTTSYSNRYWPPRFWSRVITAVSMLRATASTGNRWKITSLRFKVAPELKLESIGFSQRDKKSQQKQNTQGIVIS